MPFLEFLKGDLIPARLSAKGGLREIRREFYLHLSGFSGIHSEKGGNETREECVGLQPEPELLRFGGLAGLGGQFDDFFSSTGSLKIDDGKVAFLGRAGFEGMEMGHRFGQTVESFFDVGIGDGLYRLLGNFQSFGGGQLEFGGKIHPKDEFEFLIFFEVGFFHRRVIDEMEFFLFHGMAKAFTKEVFLELGLDIRSITPANHFKRGMTGSESGETG